MLTEPIDDLDRKIIGLLREGARTPNRHLSVKLGVAETTVAIRIRTLRKRKVMLVTLQRDFYSRGFDPQCLGDAYVGGREVEAVARDWPPC